MPDEWKPDVPNVKQDFNEAAKQQAKKEVPFASEQGISTKAELDKRTEHTRILRENLERRNAPTLIPKSEITKKVEEEKFQKAKRAYEENETTKEQIRLRLKQKKEQEMHREFNRSAIPSKD
jgi:hypothetical protein